MVLSINKYREGLTNKKKKKSKTQKTSSKGGKGGWASFISVTIYTIIFFWILFPFYSFQLQLILDQRQCKGKTPADPNKGSGKDCFLPHNKKNPPYYPCTDGKPPPNKLAGKGCPQEHVKGPDMFTAIIQFTKNLFKNMYSIVKGQTEIQGDALVQKLEKEAEQGATGDTTSKTGETSKISSSSKTGSSDAAGSTDTTGSGDIAFATGEKKILADVIADVTPVQTARGGGQIQMGGARQHGDSVNSTKVSRMGHKAQANATSAARKARKGRLKADISSPSIKANDLALEAMETSMKFSKMSIRKNKAASLCCSKFKKYGLAEAEQKGCTETGDSILNYPPFNWVLPTKFGWPYNRIYDDPTVKKPTAYNPSSKGKESSLTYWVAAWLGKSQQRSWSASRSIWSNILSLFLPFIHEELPTSVIGDRIDDFIKELDSTIEKMTPTKKTPPDEGATKLSSDTNVPKGPTVMRGGVTGQLETHTVMGAPPTTMRKNPQVKKLLVATKTNFINIKKQYEEGWTMDEKNKLTKPKRKAIDLLYQVLDGTWNSGKSTPNYFKKGKIAVQGSENDEGKPSVENVYLDFYIAATKPESLRKYSGGSFLWNFPKGSYKYWFRYIITMYMPIISMLVVIVSWFTALFLTPFSTINRYSSVILPLFGSGFLLTLYNMAAQPTETFWYMITGAFGKRNTSGKCPYDGGLYQMRRNVAAYWPLNLFFSLAIIVTSLGTTLSAEKIGGPAGPILALVFPVIIILKLLYSIITALWSLT